jgi:ABC-2 type transport system permease protein
MAWRPPVSERAAGNIYDLGYRRYEGARLGRPHAILTLYIHSVRAAFGFGRRPLSKLFPIGFTVVAFIPALVQLGFGALTSGLDADIELIPHHEYYGYVQYILLLFCATVAPELGGRDQRTRTLSLYFSRALKREDYALTKLAALTTALLVLTLGPQALLYIGNGMAGDDLWGYISEEWDLLPPIVLSALMISTVIAGAGLAIAAYLPRRSYSTVAILAVFAVPLAVSGILIGTVDPDLSRYGLLFSMLMFDGVTLWLFDVTPTASDYGHLRDADFHGSVYFLAAMAWIAVTAAILVGRFRSVAA